MLTRLTSPFRNTTGMARWLLIVGLLMTAFFLFLAVFAPWVAPTGFNESVMNGKEIADNQAPSGQHWFGTNDAYNDILSRAIWGARTAVEVVLLSLLLSLVIGVPLGLVSGYFGGWVDRLMVFVMDALYSFPSLLLALIFSFLLRDKLGGGIMPAALSLTVIYIPQYFRVVRNTTVSAREAAYVEAARAIGAKDRTIMSKYLFGNVIQSVPVIATLNAADAIGTLAGLGFLGYGIEPGEAAEWGYDLQRAMDEATSGMWWQSFFPGIAIVLLITGLTLLGEGLNETINPGLRKRRITKVIMPAHTPKEIAK